MLFHTLSCFVLASAFAVSTAHATLPPILITSVVQSGDMMPGPGALRTPTTRITFRATVACADRGSFQLQVKRLAGRSAGRAHQAISVVQTVADTCEIVAHDEEFTLSTEAIEANATMTVANPLLVEAHFVY